MRLTGGCQCGAVRYEITAEPDHATICHCRMCQKATGQAYFASATVQPGTLRWTRGAPTAFHSSSAAWREFCAQCGTPLAFRDADGSGHAVSLGTLDDPEAVRPGRQIGIESRRSWWRGEGLAEGGTSKEESPEFLRGMRSYQHPDHDTGSWPCGSPT